MTERPLFCRGSRGSSTRQGAMPKKARHPCSHPTCTELVQDGPRCPKHTKQAEQQQRNSQQANREIYLSARWQRARKACLRKDPLCKCTDKQCRHHKGRPVCPRPSTIADHIHPINQGGDPWDPDNHQGMCLWCHQMKRAKESR